MAYLEIIKQNSLADCPTIGELAPRTFITDVPNGNGCIYVKIKKRSRPEYCRGERIQNNRGIGLQWDIKHCVILNLKYGTLRQIPSDTKVTPLKPTITVTEMKPERWFTVKKEYHNKE